MSTNQQQNLPYRGPKLTPGEIVALVGMYVRAFVVLVFWIVSAAAATGAGYVALRALWWAAREVTRAIGI